MYFLPVVMAIKVNAAVGIGLTVIVNEDESILLHDVESKRY